MIVSIAKLGSSIQDVTVNEWATVMDALRTAGYSLDAVLSVKRNGQVVSMDTALTDGDVLMVSQDKVKGGSDDEPTEEKMIRLGFTVEKEVKSQSSNNGQMAFLNTQTPFEVIKTVLNSKGISMNYFKRLEDVNGNNVWLGTQLQDGWQYKIIVWDIENDSEEEENEDW